MSRGWAGGGSGGGLADDTAAAVPAPAPPPPYPGLNDVAATHGPVTPGSRPARPSTRGSSPAYESGTAYVDVFVSEK